MDSSKIGIWNPQDGSSIKFLTGHTGLVRSLTLLSNGYLASGSRDQSIKIWNTDTGSVVRTLTGHTDTVSALVKLNNGNLAIAVVMIIK